MLNAQDSSGSGRAHGYTLGSVVLTLALAAMAVACYFAGATATALELAAGAALGVIVVLDAVTRQEPP